MNDNTELIEDDASSGGAVEDVDNDEIVEDASGEGLGNRTDDQDSDLGQVGTHDPTHDETTNRELTIKAGDGENQTMGDAASVNSASGSTDVDEKAGPSTSHPVGDLHRLGLEVISGDDESEDEGGDASYDIVAIHGLHEWSRSPWMTSSDNEPYRTWLTTGFDKLPGRHGRVMMYGFDPSENSGNAWMSYGVYNEAEALLDALMRLRRPDIRKKRRPIWFISQDIGGLIAKAAMILASRDELQYADILDCTRSMTFFNYPHRYASTGHLETRVAQFITATYFITFRQYQLDTVRATKNLSRTIIDINDTFTQTNLTRKVQMVNIRTAHQDIAAFDPFMTTIPASFVLHESLDRPYHLLTNQPENQVHEYCSIPSINWLVGDLPEHLYPTLRSLCNQVPPLFPYRKFEPGLDTAFPELETFVQPGSGSIFHLRCSASHPFDTERVSERARLFLCRTEEGRDRTFYFRFCAYDNRFTNAYNMLQAFLIQLVFQNFKDDEDFVQTVVERIHDAGMTHLRDLFEIIWGYSKINRSVIVLGVFDQCDESSLLFLSYVKKFMERAETGLRLLIITSHGSNRDESINSALTQFLPGVVTSAEYTPPEPREYELRPEFSLTAQERPYLARDGHDQAVINLLSKSRFDTSICEILIAWIKSAQDPFRSGADLFQCDGAPSPELVFKIVLMEMPATHVSWAQTLLCYMVTSLRPLRLHEFCWISDHSLRSGLEQSNCRKLTHESDTWSHVDGILDMFNGLLKAEDGEIRFRHPYTRHWLLNADDGSNARPWYAQDPEKQRHDLVVQNCLAYLCDLDVATQMPWAERFPYALEFWTHHYQFATETMKSRTGAFLRDEVLFGRWIDAYRNLPKPFQKPRKETTGLLAVAAHFNLREVVKETLEDMKHGDAWDQALIESIRMGNEAILDLLLEFHKPEFSFDDTILHEAVGAAGYCGSSKIFRQVVDFIPEPPYPIPELTRAERRKDSRENSNNDYEGPWRRKARQGPGPQAYNDQRSGVDPTLLSEEGKTEKHSDPFRWLAIPLVEASKLRLDDIVTKLISRGADPTPPKRTLELNRTALHHATLRSYNDIIKLLIDGGAYIDETDIFGRTPLGVAAAASTVKMLLENGAAIDARKGMEKLLPLQHMAMRGRFAALEAILEFKDFHEYYGEEGHENHPIHLAAQNQNAKCLDILLRHGFNPNIANEAKVTPLWGSIQLGRIDMCRVLLERGADPNLVPDKFMPPFHVAIVEGRQDIMRLLLEHGADIEIKEPAGWGRTPLQKAIDFDRIPEAEFLIENGANPNVQDLGEMRPLYAAAEKGLTSLVRKLLEAKADINSFSRPEKWTAAHGAFDHPDTLAALIELGADLLITTTRDYTPLDIALINGCDVTMEDLLTKSNVDFDLSLPGAQRALVSAVDGGFVDAVEIILEAGADVNTVDAESEDNKNEPLIAIAMQFPDDAMLRKLLEFRPDLNQTSDLQNTALHSIKSATPVSSVKLLVNAGGRLDALNKNRTTPLVFVADVGNTDVFKYMLSKEAARSVLHITPREGAATALHVACFKGNIEMVQLLLDQNMDVNFACDGMFGTPLMSALMSYDEGNQEQTMIVIRLLLERGADPNKQAGFFGCPIIVASISESPKCVQLLLDEKVSIDVKDRFGRKPVHMACYNSLQVLDLLDLPDSDFATKDVVGRVPLHYAVCSGQIDLLREVIARSARVGIGINVEDDDGWTPLLWAARNSPALGSPNENKPLASDMVSALLEEGAKPDVEGRGFSTTFSASQVAYYQGADNIGDLILSKQGKEPPKTKRRGKAGTRWCECCLLGGPGSHFKCEDCYNFSLCFKCYKSRSLFHPDHSFRDEGAEWDDTEEKKDEKAEGVDTKKLETISEADEINGSDEGFDDEIVG